MTSEKKEKKKRRERSSKKDVPVSNAHFCVLFSRNLYGAQQLTALAQIHSEVKVGCVLEGVVELDDERVIQPREDVFLHHHELHFVFFRDELFLHHFDRILVAGLLIYIHERKREEKRRKTNL